MKRTLKIVFLATLLSGLYLASCSRGDHGTEGKYPAEGFSGTTDPDNHTDNTDVNRNYNQDGENSRDMSNGRSRNDGSMNDMDTSGMGSTSYDRSNGNGNNMKTGTSSEYGTYNRPQGSRTTTTTTTTSSKKTYTNPNSVTE